MKKILALLLLVGVLGACSAARREELCEADPAVVDGVQVRPFTEEEERERLLTATFTQYVDEQDMLMRKWYCGFGLYLGSHAMLLGTYLAHMEYFDAKTACELFRPHCVFLNRAEAEGLELIEYRDGENWVRRWVDDDGNLAAVELICIDYFFADVGVSD